MAQLYPDEDCSRPAVHGYRYDQVFSKYLATTGVTPQKSTSQSLLLYDRFCQSFCMTVTSVTVWSLSLSLLVAVIVVCNNYCPFLDTEKCFVMIAVRIVSLCVYVVYI